MAQRHSSSRGDLLATLRSGAASLSNALSLLATRKKQPPETAVAPTSHKPVPEGRRWGQLVLLEKVGEGSFGEVYRAWDVTLEREVALKLMRAAEEDPALIQEARMLARLRHPNVVTVYGVDRHDGQSGVWMDFVEGDTLADLVEERGSFGAMEALLAGVDVCRALAAVHQCGLLHRDIKVQNVMRERGGRIVLMDFGLGREASEGASTEFGGTPLYMAPELFEGGGATVRSDLYSAGVLLFYLVTRSYPVEGDTLGALQSAHASRAGKTLRDLRSDLPTSFVRTVEKAIAAEPSRRYATAGQMIAALEVALGAGRHHFAVSRRVFWSTAAGVAALGGGLGYRFWMQPSATVKTGALLLLTEISNATGDSQLNSVADVLRVQLAQSAHFNLLDNDRVTQSLARMTKPADTRLEVPVAREVALRSSTPLLVYGSLFPLGAGYGLSVVMERIEGQPTTPQATESKQFEARNKTGLFDAIHQAATWIRHTAGEATNDIAAKDTQPEEATTSSWEALDYFTQGERLKAQNRSGDAMAVYQQAVRVDPGFALAYARLASEQSIRRLTADSFTSYRKAVDALDHRHVTRREELRIRGFYAMQTEDFAAFEDLMHMLTILYAQDSQARHYHALALRNLGRLEEARSELLESQRLRASDATIANLVVVDLLLRRSSEAASYIEKLPANVAGNYIGRMKFLTHDYAGAEAAFSTASAGTDTRRRSLASGASGALLAELGRHHEAATVLEQGIAVESQAGFTAEQARKRLALAHLRLIGGQHEAVRPLVLEAIHQDPDTLSLMRGGSLLARAGFPADARAARARMQAPDEGPRADTAGTILDAEIAAAEGRIEEALSGFDKADHLTAPIRPREFLARALQKAGRKEDALRVWQRIASKPELVWSEPPDTYDPGLWSESLLSVAELSLQTGSRNEGRAALDQFLQLRRHGDQNSPQSALAQKLLDQSH